MYSNNKLQSEVLYFQPTSLLTFRFFLYVTLKLGSLLITKPCTCSSRRSFIFKLGFSTCVEFLLKRHPCWKTCQVPYV